MRSIEAKILLALGALALAAFLFIALSKGGNHDEQPPATGAQAPPSAAAPERPAPKSEPSPAPPPAAPPRATIVVRDGAPVGGIAKLEFEAGDRVRITVRSDVADELHLHGYDISRPVAAGGAATLAFTADLEGVFELELEERAVPLAELLVNP